MTDYLENALLNHVLRNTPYTPPANIYIALFVSAPGETGGGTEVSGGNYARQITTFTAPVDGQVSNSVDVIFPVATSDWGTVTHFALFDDVSAGNMLSYGQLTLSREVRTGDQPIFRQGELIVTLD